MERGTNFVNFEIAVILTLQLSLILIWYHFSKIKSMKYHKVPVGHGAPVAIIGTITRVLYL